MSAITPGDVGTTKPLGVYDPLGLMTKMPDKYRRWQEMEIKHGRLSMAAFLGVITTYSGLRWPGYLSTSMDLKFEDIPAGSVASWEALPQAGWAQIVAYGAFLELSRDQLLGAPAMEGDFVFNVLLSTDPSEKHKSRS